MKDLSKVLFITDLDGTLLPSNKKPNSKDLRMIEKFRNAGGIFTVATGRAIQSASMFFDNLKIKTEPVIVCNGSGIFDMKDNRFIWQKFVDDSAYDVVQHLLDKFPQAGGEVSLNDKIIVARMNDEEKRHLYLSGYGDNYEIYDQKDIPSDGWCKFLFAAKPEVIDQMVEYVSENIKADVTFVRSSATYFEIVPNECTKGDALKKLKEIYNLNDWITAACGDFDNDLEMIKNADIGTAPSNAQDCVKKAAAYVTTADCNSGAIAEALEYVMNIL